MSSRTQVAQQVAGVLQSGGDRAQIIAEVAAWLYEHGKTRQAPYLIDDVMQALASDGYVFATITSARPIPEKTRKNINTYLLSINGVKQIECEYLLDASLIGGMRIDTPLGMLDASVRARLAKIVEGVSR